MRLPAVADSRNKRLQRGAAGASLHKAEAHSRSASIHLIVTGLDISAMPLAINYGLGFRQSQHQAMPWAINYGIRPGLSPEPRPCQRARTAQIIRRAGAPGTSPVPFVKFRVKRDRACLIPLLMQCLMLCFRVDLRQYLRFCSRAFIISRVTLCIILNLTFWSISACSDHKSQPSHNPPITLP